MDFTTRQTRLPQSFRRACCPPARQSYGRRSGTSSRRLCSVPRRVDKAFRVLQLVSAALYSLGHGTNDAQKTMGIIVALLVSSQALFVNFPVRMFHLTDANHIPTWVILSAQ